MFKKALFSVLFTLLTITPAFAKVVFQTDLFSSDGTTLTPLYGLVLSPSTITLSSGVTPITGGINGQCLYDNAGLIGTQACSAASSLTIGSTVISGGTTSYVLFNNAGVLGNQAISGLSISWSQITGTPTTLSGYGITSPLPIAQGGTNASTANAALNNLLPTQTSNSGKVLSTNGTNASWVASGGIPTRPAFIEVNAPLLPQNSLNVVVADNSGSGYVYLCYNLSPAVVQKYSKSQNQIVGTVTLNSGENFCTAAALDNANGFFYVGTGTTTGLVAKINVSSMTEVGSALAVHTNGGSEITGAMNVVGSVMYVAVVNSSTDTMSIVNLSSFTLGSAITVPSVMRGLYNGCYDGTRYIYYGSDTSPGYAAALDTTGNTFGSTLTLSESKINGFATDGTYLYGTNNATNTTIIKIVISGFTEITGLTTSLTNSITSPVYNPTDGKLYAWSGYTPFVLLKVDLVNFVAENSMNMVPATGGGNLCTGSLDAQNNALYIPSYESPSTVNIIGLSY